MNTNCLKYLLYSATMLSTVASAQDATGQDASAQDIVNLPFRQVESRDVIQDVSVVDVKSAFEKNYTTYSMDGMQALAAGYLNNGTHQLWNMGEALVVVDGVVRDINNVLPSEIDQISFLKGANAVVLYGSRAAKGVILITTKRGHSDGLKVNVRGNYSLQVAKALPKYLGGAQYMDLYNQALANDGLPSVYSESQIFNTAIGSNPARYPDVNMFSSDYLKKTYSRWDATAEFEGGGEYAHFYTNIGYYREGDMLNFGEGKNDYTDRLNVRGNIDLRLNEWVTGWVNASATYYDTRNCNGNYWEETATLRPNRVPIFIPLSAIEENDVTNQLIASNSGNIYDGQYLLGGTQMNTTNSIASMFAGGYTIFTSRQLQFDAGFRINLDKIVKGLSFRSQFAVDYSTSYNTSYENKYATYDATWTNYNGVDQILALTQLGKDERTGTQSMSNSAERQTLMASAQFDYDRSFGEHNVNATLVGHGYQLTTSGEYHRRSNVNLGIQANYNYAHKYYADFGAAVVHSAKLAEGHRNVFSPSVTLGWRITGENWMKDQNIVNDLMLTAGYSVLNQDLDITGGTYEYYMHKGIFTSTGGWWAWSDTFQSKQGSDSEQGANEDLTFVKRKELTIGLKGQFFDKKLNASFSWFNTRVEGLVVSPNSIFPSYLNQGNSSFMPWINYGENKRYGVDFSLKYTNTFGDWKLSAGLNGMVNFSEVTRADEVVAYDYLSTVGKDLNAIWGLECIGFYNDEADIKNSPVSSFATCKPGDLKYKDQNGDGIIDNLDNVVLGSWNSTIVGGFDLTAQYKNFTIYALFTGSFGGQGVKNDSYNWVYGDRKYSDVVLGAWTPATKNTAIYPRLTTQGGDNNFRTSDFWVYNTDRLDLAKIQLTYNFEKSLFNNSFVKGVQVYASGNSLATFSKEREQMERVVGGKPQVRSYNIGVRLDF